MTVTHDRAAASTQITIVSGHTVVLCVRLHTVCYILCQTVSFLGETLGVCMCDEAMWGAVCGQ